MSRSMIEVSGTYHLIADPDAPALTQYLVMVNPATSPRAAVSRLTYTHDGVSLTPLDSYYEVADAILAARAHIGENRRATDQ